MGNKDQFSAKKATVDFFQAKMSAKEIKVGMACRIAGYPGGENRFLYKHIDRVINMRECPDGGIKLRYECDATSGMCGSSIMITVPDFVEEKKSEHKDLAKF
jgi:V8-like Glu-specific endopeptidase